MLISGPKKSLFVLFNFLLTVGGRVYSNSLALAGVLKYAFFLLKALIRNMI